MADNNEEILFSLNADGNAPQFFADLDELIQQADASMAAFGAHGADALDSVSASADEAFGTINDAASQLEEDMAAGTIAAEDLANGIGGIIPPINNLGAALGSSGGPMGDFTNGLVLLADQLNRLNPDVDAFISKQIEATDAALSTAQALLDMAEAGGAEEAAIKALQATIDSLTGRLETLSEAQDALDMTFRDSSTAASDFTVALLALGDAYSQSNVAIQEQIDKQIVSAQGSRDAAQALKEYAYANGATMATVDQLSMVVDGLTNKISALKDQQAILNDIFGSQAPAAVTGYTAAVDTLIDALDSMGTNLRTTIDAQAESAKAAMFAAQALYDSADAATIGVDAYDRLGAKLTELTDRYTALATAQRMAADAGLAAAETPAPGAGGGGGGGPTQSESQGNAFMLLALATAAYSAGKAFVDLGVKAESSLTTMQAMTNTSVADMGNLTASMETLGVQTGFGLSTMSDAMYKVHSAFSSVSDSMLVMTAAAKLARAGNSDLTSTADALITAMSAYGDSATKAGQDAQIMAVATLYGKQTMAEFNTQIGVVAATGKEAGLTFAEVSAAEATLSLHMHNGSQAARDLANLFRATAYDVSTVAANVTKLGLSFNEAKFQTLDWAGKLEYLNTFTAGNAQLLTQMIGGAGDLKTAMDGLNISTKQIAANAITLGLNFDSAKYNSLGLAQQLQYLLDVSGGSATRFQTLVGGAKNLDNAFKGLDLATDDVAAKAKQLGLVFDEAKYKNDTFIQKLQMLRDISKGNATDFHTLTGGVAGSNAALMLLTDVTDKNVNSGGKYNEILQKMGTQSHFLDTAFSTAMGSVSSHAAQLGAVIENMSYKFLEAVKPTLTVFLGQLSNAMVFLSQHMEITTPIIAAIALAIGVLLVGAIATVIGTMGAFFAAAAPFIAIGAAIGAAAGIIIVNWGRIAPVLAPVVAVFHSLGATLGPVLAALGRILVGVWQDLMTLLMPAFKLLEGNLSMMQEIWGRFTSVLKPLLPILQGIGLFILGVLVVALGLLVGVLSAVASGLGFFLSGLVSVISGVTGMLMGLVQIFTGVLTIIHGIFTLNGNEIREGFSQLGKGILNVIEGLGLALVGVFVAIFGTIYGIVAGFITGVISFFVGLYNNLVGHSIIPDMLNAMLHWFTTVFAMILAAVASWIASVGSFFANLYSNLVTITGTWVFNMLMWIGNLAVQAIAKIQSLVGQITGYFNNLAGMAVQWGSDLISGFISGVQGMAGNLINTISGLAGKVAAFLHFTKPDVGPLATADEWMPHFGDLLESGMLSNVSKLQAASHKMALAAGSGIAIPSSGVGSLGTGNQSQLANILSQILSTLQQQSSTNSRIGTPATLAGLTAITQQFGSVNINGVHNPMQLHRQLNMLAGLAQEYADRGALSGLAV